MSESEKSVVGVLAIERIVGPVAVEAARAGPKRIDEIEAGFFHGSSGAFIPTSACKAVAVDKRSGIGAAGVA
jgi:hypothetical protein